MTTFSRLLSSFVGVAIMVGLCLLVPTYLFTKRSIDSRVEEGLAQRMLTIQNIFEDMYQEHLGSTLKVLIDSTALNDYLLASEVEKPVFRKGVEKRFLESLAGKYGFETILYINPQGRNEIGVSDNRRIVSFDYFCSEQPEASKVANKLFAALSATPPGEIRAEGPYRTAGGKTFFVAGSAKRDPDTGRDGGAVVIVVDLKELFDGIDQIRLFNKNSFWVLSPAGTVLKTPLDRDAAFDPMPYLGDVGAIDIPMRKVREGILISHNFFVAPGTPLISVVMTIPFSLLFNDVSAAVFFFAVLFLIAILIATAVSFGMSRYLTKPFLALSAAFSHIAKGDFNYRSQVTVSGDLKALIDQFNEMVTQLQQSTVSRDLLLQEIDQRKKTEVELSETHGKLKESVLGLIQAEKLTALGELTAGIAHELNQPLNVTKIICQGILRDIEKNRFSLEEAKNDLPQVVVQMNKMSEIITHMRIFTRRSDGAVREKCDINAVVTDVLRFVTQQYKDHNVQLVKETADSLPPVLGDQIQLEQVIMNLLTNARHALESTNKSEKRITIRTARLSEGAVVIEITDNGSGIPEKFKTKIFQQFFTTKEPGKGTGLGLSLCRQIIEEHKGTISFDSIEGEGTTFRVILPAIKSAS